MRWFESLVQDLRSAVRGWRRSPDFALAAIVTLALGIGANTAIFSVVSGVLLRPLPFRDPARLAQLSVTSPSDPRLPPRYVTSGDLQAWRNAASIESAVTYSTFSMNLQNIAEPEQVQTVRAERRLFAVLGVDAMLGRTFVESEPRNVAVASAGFWQRHFGGEVSAIGRSITLDGEPFTLVGVMPDEFQFPYRSSRTELWIPWTAPQNPKSRLDAVVGRLKPGIAADAVREELSAISGRLAQGRSAIVTPLAEVVGGPVRQSLLVLLGAVMLVLLVAAANVANLLLARAAARSREVAIRTALGAGRSRLIRQFLTESLLLALTGGLVGLGLGERGSALLLSLAGDEIPRAWEIGFDWRVFAFLSAVCLAAGVGFGIAPALGAARADVQRGLKTGERGSASRGRLRDGLVVAEVALAFVLLAGAGLLLRTFLNLQRTPTGFDPENVLSLHLVVAGADEAGALENRVAQVPGVRSVGFISLLPLQSSNWYGRFSVEGRAGEGSAEFRYVTPGYFRTMVIPIRRGRAFSESDGRDAPKVLLVNEAFARQYFPNEDPIGWELTGRGRIVGVVGDVRQNRLEQPAVAEIYYPVVQNFAQIRSLGSTMLVRGNVPVLSLGGAVRQAVREVNPNLAVFRVQTMERVVSDSVAIQRLYLWLLGLFAGLGTLLAAAGIYGVISYLVTLRTQEFGIRMALGANAGRVVRLVMGRGGALVALGLAIGFGGAAALTRLLGSVLYGVTATDPATFAGMGVLLAAVALAACLVPARRAARVDPAVALRSE